MIGNLRVMTRAYVEVSAWRHFEIELPIIKQGEFELRLTRRRPPNPRGVEQRGPNGSDADLPVVRQNNWPHRPRCAGSRRPSSARGGAASGRDNRWFKHMLEGNLNHGPKRAVSPRRLRPIPAGHNNDQGGRRLWIRSTEMHNTGNRRRGDGGGRSAARVCAAVWAGHSSCLLLRKRRCSHPLRGGRFRLPAFAHCRRRIELNDLRPHPQFAVQPDRGVQGGVPLHRVGPAQR